MVKQRRGLAMACALAALTLLSPAAVRAATHAPSYHSPGYKGTRSAPRTKRTPPAAPVALSPQGRLPQVLVDAAGTAHIVWAQDNGDGADVLRYCRLRRGAKACDNPPATQAFVPDKTYGPGDGPQFNSDTDGPRIVALGNRIAILTHRYPSPFTRPDGSSGSNSTLMWISDDGGTSFTGPTVVGDQNINGGALVYGPADDPSIGVITDTVTGGTFFQSLHPGKYTSAKANLGNTGPDQAYSGSLALADGRPVAAFENLQFQTFVREWTGADPITDPSTWTDPAMLAGDEPRLAGGPSGLFLMARPKVGAPYAVQRLDHLRPGPGVTVSDSDSPAFRDFFEDPGGHLFAAWESRGGKTPGLRLRTSADGRKWAAPQVLYGGQGIGQIDVGATDDAGGLAVFNRDGGASANGALFAAPFGNQGPTGKPGLGGLPGGGNATTGCEQVSFGVVHVQSEAGCFLRGTGAARHVRVGPGTLRLNGLELVPDANVKILVDPHAHTLDTTGSVAVDLQAPGLPPVVLWHGELHIRLPHPGQHTTLASFDTRRSPATLEGFPIRGRIDVELLAGAVRVPVSVQLPKAFGGLRGAATLAADNAAGLHPTSLQIVVDSGFLGTLELRHLALSYSGTGAVWRGGVSAFFPPAGQGGSLGFEVAFDMGRFQSGTVTASVAAPGVVIGPFVYLTSIGGTLDLAPTHIGASAGVGAGRRAAGGGAPVQLDGHFDMSFPAPPKPADFAMTGGLSLFFIRSAAGRLAFTGASDATFGGPVKLDLLNLHVDGSLAGFVDGASGDLGGRLTGSSCIDFATACLAVGRDIVLSDSGFAACTSGDLPVVGKGSVGYAVHWGDYELDPHDIRVPCHTGAYRVDPRALARASQAAGTPLTIPAGLPSETIAVTGVDTPPNVTATGPGGETVAATGDPSRPGSSAAGYALQVPAAKTTYLVLVKPAPGTWTLSLQDGSPPVASLAESTGYTAATVKARLGGQGRSRTIAFAIRHLGAGQTVVFEERGAFGTRSVGVVRRARGTLHFTAADAPGGRRTVTALVEQDGLAISRRTVGTYTAPAPTRPGRVGSVAFARRSRSLTVRWSAATGAAQYAVRISGSHGRRRLVIVPGGRQRLRVGGLVPGERVTVSVAAVSRAGRRGPATVAR